MQRDSKRIYDAVHGFIRLNDIETELINSYPFQRLHYLHQLGIAYLVYPGATHSRFEHSLGVMEIASQIFDRIVSKFAIDHPIPDLLFWRQIIRLAALCHDLGHLPFSHVAESRILSSAGHERWSMQIIKSPFLKKIWKRVEEEFSRYDIETEILKISIGEEKLKEIFSESEAPVFSAWEKVMSQIITGDFFGADRIDYLLRDARCTGVSYGLFDYHQLIETLCITPVLKEGMEELILGIEENGIESIEALLLARHFMHKRVYQYPSVKAYSFHMSRFMEVLYNRENPLKSLESYLAYTDNEVLVHLRKIANDPLHEGYMDALAILDRKSRFRALEIPPFMKEVQLEEMRELLNINEQKIAWILTEKKNQGQQNSFPVILKNKTIVSGAEYSEMLIPSLSKSWLFVASENAAFVQESLEKFASLPV